MTRYNLPYYPVELWSIETRHSGRGKQIHRNIRWRCSV